MLNDIEKRKPTLKEAVIALLLVITVILISIKTALVLETALVLGTAAAVIVGFYLGYSWEDIEKGMLDGMRNGLGACIILIVIGMVIGTWILGGTIQTMIYYGLKLLTPQIFVPAGFMLCALTSVLIGSSFGTIATMGIVLMGVAEGLNIPRAITAGAIVSGAMFGDKVSPLSDSTNLTAAMTGTKLFDHVRSMLYVSGPSVAICLAIYGFVGHRYAIAGSVDFGTVESILTTLSSNFNLSIMTLIPPAIVIILSVLKVPAIIALMISFISAGALSIFTQGASLAGIIEVGANGFISNTGHELIDKLLTQGGINSMMSTVAIIMAGTAMGGILEKCGILQVLLENLMKHIKKPRDLILASLASAYIMLLATGEMMVSIIVPGRTLEPAFHEMKIHTSVLSRTLETGATLMCGALPWGVASVYAQNVLNVGLEYIPYCYLPFIAPIIAIIYAFVGFATFPAEPEES
ncbi:Na+/H+ antiporter NhaC [Tepidanaerobacter acetatoxydans]|uniref:Na+/H+ antiporter NhaC n=1 Tax=Tepidanaerobacter acetatoxydans TaxID=499229 RepID=UPI001BD5F1D9|nr:Na+/H+ antiporter NhaC [Tepidanaerobacter acetatoxydans]